MAVLLTEAASPLGRALAAQLGPDVRLTDRPGVADNSTVIESTFGPDDATDALVEGVDVLVHLTGAASSTATGVTDTEWVDACIRVGRLSLSPSPRPPLAPSHLTPRVTQDTYNLLRAASRAGVRKVVLVTTLDVFLPYPADSDCLA